MGISEIIFILVVIVRKHQQAMSSVKTSDRSVLKWRSQKNQPFRWQISRLVTLFMPRGLQLIRGIQSLAHKSCKESAHLDTCAEY